jgi:hypothetical protein
MTTIEFDVPDHIQQAFDHYFMGEDRDVVFTRLLEEAIAKRKREEESSARRAKALEDILELRKRTGMASNEEISQMRQDMRD